MRPLGRAVSAAPEPGDILAGKYRIRRVIASGGMGTVYEAEHMGLDRVVAVKMLQPQAATSDEMLARFRREAKIGAAIDSPHVARVFDIEQLPDGRFIVVHEFLAGGSLRDRLRHGGAMPEADTRALLGQVCAGLSAAHEAGVIHRDLKPDNVVFEGDQPKLIDFGIARLTEQATQLTQEGQVLGTLSYMAPELFRGDDAAASSDIYALGVMAYEMLSGARPHSATTVPELLAQKLQEDVAPLADTAPSDVTPELSELVGRMLDREPSFRPSLEEVMRGLGTPPSTGTAVVGRRTPPPTPTPVSGPTLWIAIGAAVVGAAIVLGVIVVATSADDEVSQPPTIAEASEPTPVEVEPAPATVGDEAALAPDASAPSATDAVPAEAASEVAESSPEPDVVVATGPAADAAAGPGASTGARPLVRIISQPPGADVFLDGARVGATPFDLPTTGELPAVTLVLKTVDYQDREIEVDLRRVRQTGVQQMEYALEPATAEPEPGAEPEPAVKKRRRPKVATPAPAVKPAPAAKPKLSPPKKPGLAVD